MTKPGLTVRPPTADEVDTIAARMRATLAEVLDPDRATAMFTMDELLDRVRWHLDPDHASEVWVAVLDGTTVGHTMVREDVGIDGDRIGLFATTYVDPAARRQDVATRLLEVGEAWMRDRGLLTAVTYTDPDNVKLIGLYERRGYTCSRANDEFVQLRRPLR